MKRVDLVYMGLLDDDFEANQIDFFNPVGPRDFDADLKDKEEWEYSPFNTDGEVEWATEIGVPIRGLRIISQAVAKQKVEPKGSTFFIGILSEKKWRRIPTLPHHFFRRFGFTSDRKHITNIR